MLKRLLSTAFLAFAAVSMSMAQVGQGAIRGKITDKETGEFLPFVNVIVSQGGIQVGGASSDFDGNYLVKPLAPGKYDVKASFVGYQDIMITDVVVKGDGSTYQNLQLGTGDGIDLDEVIIVGYKVPLIEKGVTSSGATITNEDIMKMPGRSATSIAQTVGGVYSQDDGSGNINVRGSRSDANYYFIDGIKVRGGSNLPQSAIGQIEVITGGVPAKYGDATGAIVNITSAGAKRDFNGGFEYVTSGFKAGDRMIGLDPYGYNLLEFSLMGPVLFNKDSAGNKLDPIVGFMVAGNLKHIVDERPSAIGTWRVKDESRAYIDENPLRRLTGGSTPKEAEFLRLNDFEKLKTRENTTNKGYTLQGKLDIKVSETANLSFGGNIDYSKDKGWPYYNSFLELNNTMFNSENNPIFEDTDWRVYGRFTQRFKADESEADQEASAATIKNAYYSIQADFQQNIGKNYNETHGQNYFDYGYIGKFTRYSAPEYERGEDENGDDVVVLSVLNSDTLVSFQPGEQNPLAASYTSAYYELNGWDFANNTFADYDLGQGKFEDIQTITQNGGLVNGGLVSDNINSSVYNLFRTPIYEYGNYGESVANQFRVTGQGSGDIKNHALSIGFEYEQRTDRQFSISPIGLWTIGRQLTNAHVNELDEAGAYRIPGTPDTIMYPALNTSPGAYNAANQSETQSFFDYNIRKEVLGWNPDGTDQIDFDAIDPENLKLEYFDADELLNNGNNYVSYYGYDYTGKKMSSSASFDQFFTERDEYGNLTRPIDAFRPVYMAGYIQDKFEFEDLVFFVGVRVDRYDANQQVLKDPYSLFPTVKAGEDLGALGIENYEKPSTIGDDYVVYVDNQLAPTSVLGYRDGNTWYNAQGTEIESGNSLRTANGIIPLLVDRTQQNGQDLTSASFEDYTPQTNVMPRIQFSFPISDDAQFFAHYDVLTQRPTTGTFNNTRLDPLAYYFIESRTDRINNPNLKPQKTIDYEIGFEQKLSQSSKLKLQAFYRELRDLVQVVNFTNAYPKTYISYDNIDFATVKGTTIEYDLRRTGNLRTRVAYTLQFAEGTGSNANSGLNLVRSNKPNLKTINPLSYDQRHAINATLDYRYKAGKDYNGPYIGEHQILANTGANLVFNLGSGTPYNKQKLAQNNAVIGDGSAGNGSLDGRINGSRLPWSYRIDARIDKDIQFAVGGKEEGSNKKDINLNVYVQVLNLLNTMNISSVYRYTGNPDDDGYLVSPQAQKAIAAQNDEQSFREMYTIKVNDPSNYSLPRRIRLGIMFNF